jgi:guanine deaminase
MNPFMRMAIEESRINLSSGEGGPFGAVIVRNGEVIARARNVVLQTNDPTMHAEINAIRIATKKLGTFDLSDCELYTSCEPCPMCLAAMIWAKINRYYYGNTRADAAGIGFDDDAIYQYLAGDQSACNIRGQRHGESEAKQVFAEWSKSKRRMY